MSALGYYACVVRILVVYMTHVGWWNEGPL